MRIFHAQGLPLNTPIFDPAAPKKSVNLSINADLLEQAKKLDLNLSQTLERHLAEVVRHAQNCRWLEENKNALDEYNRRVALSGTFSDGLRRF